MPAMEHDLRAPLERAIELVKGKARMAELLGITLQAVSQWEKVPVDRVQAVIRATNWQMTAEDLRPDIFIGDSRPSDTEASDTRAAE